MNFLRDGGWLVLIPGFIALFVAGFVSDFPNVRDAQLPIVYVVLSLLSGAVPLLMYHVYGVLKKKSINLYEVVRQPLFYGAMLFCSIGWGFAFGLFYTSDEISYLLQSAFGPRMITVASQSELLREALQRSADTTVGWRIWDGRQGKGVNGADIAHNDRLYLRVRVEGESTIFEGAPEKWFGGDTERQIYLSPACRIDNTTQVDMVPGPGVWINLKDALSIEFIDQSCSRCASMHDALQHSGRFDTSSKATPQAECFYPSP